jgi:hypothetical protein
MSNNLYAAPLANLDEHVQVAVDDRFHIVSQRKLMIMILATAGLYLIYWNYKNWAKHRDATGASVWPVPRSIFAVFFTHSLFREFGLHDATGQRGTWDSNRYATPLVLVMVANYVLSWTSGGSTIMQLVAWLTIIPTALILKQVQGEVNARCGDPDGSSNDSFTGANIAWCVIGCLIWLFALAGLLIGSRA